VNHDYLAVFRQDNIGLAWQVRPVESEAVTHPMQERPNDYLRLCILATNARHQLRSVLRTNGIHCLPTCLRSAPGQRAAAYLDIRKFIYCSLDWLAMRVSWKKNHNPDALDSLLLASDPRID
jgi:hypothetical protein